jgi:hypothetical protein
VSIAHNHECSPPVCILTVLEGTLYSLICILIKKRRDITPTYTSTLQLGVRSLPLFRSHNIPSLLDTSWSAYWGIFYVAKVVIICGLCRKSGDLGKSGYKPDMKHKSSIILLYIFTYILKIKCKKFGYFNVLFPSCEWPLKPSKRNSFLIFWIFFAHVHICLGSW